MKTIIFLILVILVILVLGFACGPIVTIDGKNIKDIDFQSVNIVNRTTTDQMIAINGVAKKVDNVLHFQRDATINMTIEYLTVVYDLNANISGNYIIVNLTDTGLNFSH
jgi:hypothetical protein